MRIRHSIITLAFALFVVTPAFAQRATVTIFSTGVDGAYSGSIDGDVALPFGIGTSGYFNVNDVDGASREDARVVATRAVARGVIAVYEFRTNDVDAPNRFGVGYRVGSGVFVGVNAVYFPYGVDFDTNTVDEDGQTVQVNGSRALGGWRVDGKLHVTRRDGATRYWGEASASLNVAPGVAFVGEYRARPVTNGVFAHDRSVWFGVGVDVVR